MKNTSLSILALAVAATGVMAETPVLAQDLQRGETVLERRRPEVGQLGVRAGGFLVLPRVETGLTYDTNIFATDRNTESDFIAVVRPQLNVRSDWNRHALNFSAGAEMGRYFDFSKQNYLDYTTSVGGRLDVVRDASVGAELFHNRRHEGAGDTDNPFAAAVVAEPTKYYISGGEANYSHAFGRFRGRLGVLASYYDYTDAELTSGARVSQDARDRWEYSTSLRVGYQFLEGYEAFIQGSLGRTNYTHQPAGATTRDSNGYEVVVGTAVDLTGLITGEVFAGYLSRDYEANLYKDFQGIAFGGRLNWAVTQLTSVSGSVSRHVRETLSVTGAGTASSYTRTLFALGVDHELLRTLLLNGRAQYRLDDFNGIDRTDNVYTLGVGATYLINRNFYLTGGYTFETRQSDVANDYRDNLIYLRVGAQL